MNEFHIQYLPHSKIDKTKWDKCINEAANGLIYGYSFYLDYMARHWDGLVLKNYEAVMPLTWNKKFGVYYLYQPSFTANLGIFSNNVSDEVIKEFILRIHKKFRLIEISLNADNFSNSDLISQFMVPRTNYVLSLNKNYNDLYQDYRENHKRNIQKAFQQGCSVKKNITVEEVIELNRNQLKDKVSLTNDDYNRFKKLYTFLANQNKATAYGIVNSQNQLLSSSVFFFSHQRAYYIIAGNHPESRDIGASHALIDFFIKDHANQNLFLDFEGSDIESLALFYSGFGATKEIYPAIRWNRLQWYLKWLKK
jgi:hypothetical protein